MRRTDENRPLAAGHNLGFLAVLCAGIVWAMAAPLAAQNLPEPVQDSDYVSTDPAEVALGQLLFYDPILSGNKNISCATCHHPKFATSDGVSLGIGEGGIGLGPDRKLDANNVPEKRIPRNSPGLFNLGAREFTALFHDGRIEADASRPSGLRTPLDEDMLTGFSGVLSAQNMFPVLSADEMAGHYGENDISKAVRQGLITGEGGAWDIIADRVADVPEYRRGFEALHGDIAAGREIAFTDISNAIAAFVAFEWRADNSLFDRVLRGQDVLSGDAADGMALFYGEAGCAACHSGVFQTDHDFHAMGVAQIGPGKAASFEGHVRDEGRMRVTGRDQDAYAFRTPSLRNVLHTAPYGHDGAYGSLSVFLAAHVDPAAGLDGYDRGQVVLPPLDGAQDWVALDDPAEMSAILQASGGVKMAATTDEIARLIAFLGALTDQGAIDGRLGVPVTVPSGLPVDQ